MLFQEKVSLCFISITCYNLVNCMKYPIKISLGFTSFPLGPAMSTQKASKRRRARPPLAEPRPRGRCLDHTWAAGWATPLKNMTVSWNTYSHHMEKDNWCSQWQVVFFDILFFWYWITATGRSISVIYTTPVVLTTTICTCLAHWVGATGATGPRGHAELRTSSPQHSWCCHESFWRIRCI